MITVTNKLVAVLQKIKKSASLTMLLTALLCAGCTHQDAAHFSTAQSSTAQGLGSGGGGGTSAAGADPQATKGERPLNVVTTTGLLRDLVKFSLKKLIICQRYLFFVKVKSTCEKL